MSERFLHGCHLSIAGGIERAIDEAERLGISALQIFTHSPSVWAMAPLSEETATSFRERRAAAGIGYLVVHTPYLLNLATPDDALWERSTAAFVAEIDRAASLGADAVVTHLGAHRGAGVKAGIRRIVAALEVAHREASFPASSFELLLENTAGAGTTMGRTFDELAAILGASEDGRMGLCLDSCHAHAGGYDLRTRAALEATLSQIDEAVGLGRLRMIHLNDAKHPLGSRRDRHEHIGQGEIGDDGFAALINHPRLRALPFVLETPKDLEDGREADPLNLATIRRLRRKATSL
ncbi:MAG: deoxyribonuclease IV [Candidatus Bipolaricaulota bacterium]|nr:MAG: deoxyribonuclease IV [Candidatus Bipolaricaulota bacterium]